MSNFTHLHLHTPYSLLDGYSKIEKLLDRCEQYGMDSVAITDHGVMFGVLDFYKKSKKRGIKPIIGCEVYVARDSMYSKTSLDKKRYHLLLLAETNEGYKNLIKLVSEAYVNGYYYKPRVDHNLLRKYSKGIIATSACLGSEINSYLLEDDYNGGYKIAQIYKDIFGANNFFLELQDQGLPEQKKVNMYLKRMSKELNIPLVATNDVHYVDYDDAKTQDILMCIGTGATVNQEKRMRFPNSQFYFKSQEEMIEIFKDVPEAIENTKKIADRCNVEFNFDEMHLPFFEVDEDHDIYLRKLVYRGLEKKYKTVTPEIQERADFELEMLKKMGFTDYFLIVWDFIDYAKRNNIPVGPGRGSAAGSIVSYALDITGIDPLEYDLLFERFLNPHRVSMPDIDIDFCYERREEVIEYVKKKYGAEKVAQISTFGTLAAKNAIRDVGRALDIELSTVDRIAKQVPEELNITLRKAIENSKDFSESYNSNEKNKKLIDVAMELEGLPRHVSTHAAGVVIASEEVDTFVPLVRNGEQIATQFNMTEIEELGLLKMDFLGLRTLTVISDAVKLIKYNHNIEIDINSIDVNDKGAMELFTNAETIGIFQFESQGMRLFLKDLKPERFDDLIAANSLFRPGPMNEIPNYIRYRHNPSEVKYLHPSLESILDTTYGTIVFQEQVMQIVQKLGGFSLGEADNLRRAMGKKKMDVMEENREYFVNGKVVDGEVILPGCVRNGISSDIANKIYDLMIDFAKYAFNKSHSAAYSLIAMQTAWLKRYYPNEFMAALLSSVMGDASKVYLYISEAKNLGLEILPPSVNSSFKKFSVEDGKIRMGLSVIKTVGHNLVSSIIRQREDDTFKSFEDFIEKMVASETSINKKACEALILSGALDCFGLKRSQMFEVYSDIIDSYNKSGKTNILGQEDIFSFIEDNNSVGNIPDIPEFSKKDFLKYEKEYLGVYITDHPFSSYVQMAKSRINFTTLDLLNKETLKEKAVTFGGIITSVNKIITRKNQEMAFITAEDLTGSIELIAFPETYSKFKHLLIEDIPIFVNGSLQIQSEDNVNIIIRNICEINEQNFSQNSNSSGIIENGLVLYLQMMTYDDELYSKLKQEIANNPGENEVVVFLADTRASSRMNGMRVNLNNQDFINKLKTLLNSDNVIIK